MVEYLNAELQVTGTEATQLLAGPRLSLLALTFLHPSYILLLLRRTRRIDYCLSMALPSVRHGSNLTTALHRSQQAPVILGQQSSGKLLARSSALSQGGADDFDVLEKLFFSCTQSADDQSALLCLERLTHRFGSSNERVMALRGIYDEAIAGDRPGLERCLKKYDDILLKNPVNLPILKRRIALLRSLSRPTDAISSLVQLLDATPTDAEAWCELAELYQSQAMSQQAIFSLEEALLIVPHAWNVHARLGEILYIYARSLDNDSMYRTLQSSIRHFCRSIELCDDYLRGFYGLALATTHFSVKKVPEMASGGDLPNDALSRLHTLARKKLADTLTTQYSLEPHLREYEENELSAVKEMLDGSPE
ncbi:hypothetical protein BDW59DRAFT_138024 [Aspergillus cavernicola]|uniref:ER membrane protein complex subunit 2 n=1 Tax=Aspergillus cavernicola TaxID=176166 RepID=A0ABR4J3J4_9EURO